MAASAGSRTPARQRCCRAATDVSRRGRGGSCAMPSAAVRPRKGCAAWIRVQHDLRPHPGLPSAGRADMDMAMHQVHIIGGGLAGSEAAWQLARRGIRVRLSEMRGGGGTTPAHRTDGLAELVCSNSFRSDDDERNAVGLLHHEMRRLDSLIMRAGEVARVPAGSAMAVDRDVFSAEVQKTLELHPNVEIVREKVDTLPEAGLAIIATGPLTAASLAESIGR